MGRRAALVFALALAALAVASAADAAARKPAFGGQWKTWWGTAAFDPAGATLSSVVPNVPAETHSALITSKRTWRDGTVSFTQTTLGQLRLGSAPNPWEVGWVMFRFHDLENYYYFIPKPNGFELGKKQGSDAQIFLATGTAPGIAVGKSTKIVVRAQGARIRAWIDGVQVVDYVDPNPLPGAGSVGLYEEDSHVRFTSFATT